MDFAIRAAEPDAHPIRDPTRRKRRDGTPREFEEQLEHRSPPEPAPAPERAPHGGDDDGVGATLDVTA